MPLWAGVFFSVNCFDSFSCAAYLGYMAFMRHICLSFLCLLLLAPQAYAGLWGTQEIQGQNLKPFPKWRRVLDEMPKDEQDASLPCLTDTPTKGCGLQMWRQFVDRLANEPIEKKLEKTNDFMNRHIYITDPVNWGVADYWASLREFMYRDGDCEDYAIAKYVTLRAAGVPASRLRVVVLRDLNLNIDHAILVYKDPKQGNLILDNQIKQITPERVIHHYQPVFSINEDAWWLHR